MPIVSSIALVLADLSHVALVVTGAVLFVSGLVQWHRAAARARDRRYKPMRSRVDAEVGFARLWILAGLVFAAFSLALPPIVVAIFGMVAMPTLLYQGLLANRRSADAEHRLGFGGQSAVEEYGSMRTLADAVAGVLRLRPARRFVDFLNLRVEPGEIGILQTLILGVLPLAFLTYSSLAVALVVSGATRADDPPASANGALVKPKSTAPQAESESAASSDEVPPTYAESCPEIPDALTIGHGLGPLFKHDGEPKAGCGERAVEVAATSTWVATGICKEEMRSLAVAAPGRRPAMLYGEPARFAWSAALNEELVAAEAAEVEGGDVYLVETLDGTSAFTRTSPSLEPGREDIEHCWEASGVARPFVHLQPALAYLWLELVRHRRTWYWPEDDPSVGTNPITFVEPSGAVVARGGCTGPSCHLNVDDESWPGGESAFVALADFKPYMPPPDE